MYENSARILIVDDDPEITSALARGLELHGYAAISENRVDRALLRFREPGLAAAIVDVMIGADSGIDLVRTVRGEGNTTPILMLSAMSTVDDRASGLEAGADDYIVKPFSFDELVARLKVQERRAKNVAPVQAFLNPSGRSVEIPGRRVTLTQREFSLLQLLADRPDHVFSRPEIFERLWADEGASSENVVDVYVGYLRKKLDPINAFGFEINTIRNKGFVLVSTTPKGS